MAIEVTMPVLGLTMEEGTVAEWLKREGDPVAKDEPLLLVEMDKGTVEVPAPAAGVLQRIVVQTGVTVPVKTLIAEIGAVGGSVGGRASGNAGGSASGSAPEARAERLFVTPRARLRARELGIELASLRGSGGPHGRIVEADVLSAVLPETPIGATTPERSVQRAADTRSWSIEVPPLATEISQSNVATPSAARGAGLATPAVRGGGLEPMSRLRRLTAEHMAASSQAAARVTLFVEADFSEAQRFRQQLQPEFARLGVDRLPWDALIARAAALALVEHPALLREWVDGVTLRQHADINVGIGVALEPEGLVVPVLRDAAARTLRELAAELTLLADKARQGRLAPDEMQGGTFTITNLGSYRVDGFTPIVNPPETAILGVGRIADKPVVVDGRIEPRSLCTLSLSFDHRLVDGAPAAAFLARLAELLERPYALLGI